MIFQEQYVWLILFGVAGGVFVSALFYLLVGAIFGHRKPPVPQAWAYRAGKNWCVVVAFREPWAEEWSQIVGPFRSEDDANKFCEQANG